MQLTAVDFQQTNDKTKKSLSPSCLIWPEIRVTDISEREWSGHGYLGPTDRSGSSVRSLDSGALGKGSEIPSGT